MAIDTSLHLSTSTRAAHRAAPERQRTATEPRRAAWAATDPILLDYYDNEWGMPVTDETGVFERLSLEGFQAGLSWLTILKKRPAFRAAFSDFDPDQVANFEQADVERLMGDSGIIRNRAKIEATISNARATIALRDTGTDLAQLVWAHMPEVSPAPERDEEVPSTSQESVALSKQLKSLGFKFVGPTTLYALMSAIGVVDLHLVSSHRRGCSGLWNLDGTRTSRPAPR